MNSENCYYKSCCPAVMEDGRILSNWLPNQTIVDGIKLANGISKFDNNDFRLYMQKNATAIMQQERKFHADNYTCTFPSGPKVVVIQPPFVCDCKSTVPPATFIGNCKK